MPRDYGFLPATTPAWKGNLPVGHGGTYRETDAGKFGAAAVNWVQWLLRGDNTAAQFFTGAGAKDAGWTVESRSLDVMKVAAVRGTWVGR
ncbi:hypothetical protein B0T16DRAFT_236416 [Cercophora newfieldiana]|uniref:Uncharacterized protein n=1 Tax=Cercophora newfieldiana TaxID=92897 RepID=A0AA40CIT9_9PEZI|nr:hypothetical protein B0T16DRAFT_236416 [Cercophora newfieldiana]